MPKLIILSLFFFVYGLVNAQTIENLLHLKYESKNDVKLKEKNTAYPSKNIKDKNPIISSAARKSTLIQSMAIEERDSEMMDKGLTNARTISVARRVALDGRPVKINIPVIPVPGIARPNKMTIPIRRISLPVGKS